MALLNNSNLSLNEIRLKAQDVFLRNPSNEKAKKLFIQAFVTELIKEVIAHRYEDKKWCDYFR